MKKIKAEDLQIGETYDRDLLESQGYQVGHESEKQAVIWETDKDGWLAVKIGDDEFQVIRQYYESGVASKVKEEIKADEKIVNKKAYKEMIKEIDDPGKGMMEKSHHWTISIVEDNISDLKHGQNGTKGLKEELNKVVEVNPGKEVTVHKNGKLVVVIKADDFGDIPTKGYEIVSEEDGFYWEAPGFRMGPFDTEEEAEEDALSFDPDIEGKGEDLLEDPADNAKFDEATKKGLEIEKEHNTTLDFIKQYLEQNGELPPDDDVYMSIAVDHLSEGLDYYDKLEELETQLQSHLKTTENVFVINKIKALLDYIKKGSDNMKKNIKADDGPTDEDVNAVAWTLYHEHWNALSTEQMNEVYKELGYDPETLKFQGNYYNPNGSGAEGGFIKITEAIKEIDKAIEDIRGDALELPKDVGRLVLESYTKIKEDIVRLSNKKNDLQERITRMQQNYETLKQGGVK